MSFREQIKVEEGLTIYIRDRRTKKIIRKIEVKKPWSRLSWWEKLLIKLGLKKYPGTFYSIGLEQVARCFGNVSGYPVNQVGAKYVDGGGGTVWASSENSYDSGTHELVIKNENNPFPGGHRYEQIFTRNSAQSNYNYITAIVDLQGNSSVEWWAEVRFKFTQ